MGIVFKENPNGMTTVAPFDMPTGVKAMYLVDEALSRAHTEILRGAILKGISEGPQKPKRPRVRPDKSATPSTTVSLIFSLHNVPAMQEAIKSLEKLDDVEDIVGEPDTKSFQVSSKRIPAALKILGISETDADAIKSRADQILAR
jgi:hypothetical protein